MELCFAASNVSFILALLRKFLEHDTYEKELCPLYKYYPGLVLFYMSFFITKLCRVIRFLYDFGCKKNNIQQQDIGEIKIVVG